MIQETTNINLCIPISKNELPNYLQLPLVSTLFSIILKNHRARVNDPDSLPGPKGTFCYYIRCRGKHRDTFRPLGNYLVTDVSGAAPFSHLLLAFCSNKSPVCLVSGQFAEYVIIMPNHPPLVLWKPEWVVHRVTNVQFAFNLSA